MAKKTAAAIAADDAAIIAAAIAFNVYLRNGANEKISEDFPTLEEAEARAAAIRESHPGRDVLISAVTVDGRRCPAGSRAAKAKPAKEPKPAHAARWNRGRKAPAKAAKKPAKAKAAPKAKKPAKAPRKPASDRQPGGKRAAILAAAQAGKLPAAPDFSAKTHERFRPRLAEIVALVKAGDIEGLKAVKINPISSSPKAMAKYRDLAVIALEARKG